MVSKKTLLAIMIIASPVECFAQPQRVIPDRTLGSESSRLLNENNQTPSTITITGGAKRGSALFHSFSEFSVPQNSAVFFDTQPRTQTIFSRVISKPSIIDGIIGVKGNSDLILLNPNGFVFNDGARLSINGSFSAVTSQNIRFRNFNFGTSNPSRIPMSSNLDVNPLFLEFSSNSGSIDINNEGISLLQPDSSLLPPVVVGDIFSGLTNVSGGDLVFAGNIVNLNGAIINVVSGNLTLASIEQGLVDLRNSNNIANSNFSRTVKNNLNIINNSFITNTHLSNQSTNFIGKNISIFDSIASQFSSSPFSAGRVRVEADLDFTIDRFQNASVPPGFRRNIYGILSLNLADGQGSDISVDARKTIIDNGGVIFTGSFSNGNAGDISIISDVFTIDNSLTNLQSLTDNGSAITSATQGGTGNSGTIDVLASQISLRNGSQLSTGTLGLGNAEDLTIQADSIILDGFNSKNLLPTTISSNSASDGNTGNLSIFSKQLSVTNGANIGAITFDSGNAQSLFIESDTILVSGSRPDPVSGKSSIFASGARINDSAAFSVFEGVPLELTGDSGNVEIIAESLTLNNQGTISAENVGPGLGGFVDIEAESILLNSSQITSGARGNDGGSIQIASRSFKIDNSLLEAISTGDGSGGNISIDSGLLLINSSSVSTSANGTGTGGNIAVNSVYASLRNASNIQANAVNDRAGNVILNSNSAFVDRSSDITATSEVGTSSDGEVIVNQSQGEIQISKIRPVVKNEISTISSQCDSSLNNGRAIQHGLGINGSLALTERQQKALYLKQRIDYASQFYYIDSETGEKVPYQPLLAIEEGEDGNLELIFSPEQSQGLKNLLSSLDDVCSVKT